MGDENNLVPENEDTSALFVSSQKKKKAEEEAKRRAEEEQAKRDAAAAEVRRMEQEVEERRKKAEEEKLALENEEKMTAEERAKVAAQRAADKAAKEAAASNKAAKPAASPAVNSKLFIIIGAVVAVLVLAFVIVKVVGSGGGKASDYSQLGANGEYTPKASGFEIKILYPNDIYTEVTEKKVDEDNLQIFFNSKKSKDVTTNIVMTTYREETSSDGDKKMLKDNIALFQPETIQTGLTETAKKQLTGLIEDAKVTDEVTAQYSDDNPTTYTYDCKFTSGKYKSGTARAFLLPNPAGEYKVVMVCCFKAKADENGIASMRDIFVKNNTSAAFAMPGALPPTSNETDGMVQNLDMHMGLRLPKDRFVKYPHTTNYDLFSDLNGASVIVKAYDLDMYGEELVNYNFDKLIEAPKELAKTGINSYHTDVTSRVFISDQSTTDGNVIYEADYKDVIGGVTYWERYHCSIWIDATTDRVYWATIITLAPEKNKSIYKEIFDKTLSNLEDI
jgi:hypothetical protein